ncbi:MAG: relaxase [Hyphomicrobiales bacterium]|nr:relaxase [Hyphomicrobiales bacterium]
MILKASQRGGGADLAVHLMRIDDNEHVHVYELRGFASGTLKEAFKEVDAISRGTQCRQYLFSLSLSPPEQENVSADVFAQTIDRIEQRLGLDGQPRAVVFHEKEGRRHAHCVWSRIDAQSMTAKPLPFFKNKLMEVSRDLYLDHGWQMPSGMIDASARNPTNFTLAEWQQAKRLGHDPRWTKQVLQDCWKNADSRKAFESALQDRGFFLAKGDKRSHVVLDHSGEVYSLPRMLDLKTRDVRTRLGDGDDLPGVEATQQTIGERMSPAIRRHVAESRAQFEKRSATLGHAKMEMTHRHREARSTLDQRLSVEWSLESRERAARLPKGLAGLWHRLTGKYQEVRSQNEAQARATLARHAQERQKLIEQQLEQRRLIQKQFKELRGRQAAQLLSLREDVGRYLKLTRGDSRTTERSRSASLSLKLER